MAKEETLTCPKCKAEILYSEARGVRIPTPETVDKDFQEDRAGNFRIKAGDVFSQWTDRNTIAYIENEGKKFFAIHPNGMYAKTFPSSVILPVPEVV